MRCVHRRPGRYPQILARAWEASRAGDIVGRVRVKDAVGRWGEGVAERHLVERGWSVLERNWRCPAGELDLIVRRGPVLVFCEVKTRSSTAFGDPAEAVIGPKAARLRRLAGQWLQEHPGRWDEVRIDVIAIVRSRSGPPTVRHLEAVA